jgi:hypothetical protein
MNAELRRNSTRDILAELTQSLSSIALEIAEKLDCRPAAVIEAARGFPESELGSYKLSVPLPEIESAIVAGNRSG